MLLKMSERQFKRWMTNKTRQYIWLIFKLDPNRVKISFIHKPDASFLRHAHGWCNPEDQHICYRTDYVTKGWDCDLRVLENLVIHEVCHLKHEHNHPNAFWIDYAKWSGDDFIERYKNGLCDGIDYYGKYVSHISGLPIL